MEADVLKEVCILLDLENEKKPKMLLIGTIIFKVSII